MRASTPRQLPGTGPVDGLVGLILQLHLKGLVVQRIEWRFPKPQIQVRFLSRPQFFLFFLFFFFIQYA